ncbi:MAG: hypothetical protein OXF79_21175 [Chloroflexi bacterium]|nr:hypothetical protein [Chloroflexota bacterium]
MRNGSITVIRDRGRRPRSLTWYRVPSGLAVAVAALALQACPAGTDPAEVSDVFLPVDVEPRWQGAAVDEAEVLTRPEEPSRISVYIDVSSPMGGFFPLSGREGKETSTLRTLAQLTGDYVFRSYGGGGVPIDWRGVGHEIASVEDPPDLMRSGFRGTSSRLELALEEIFADFRSGRAEVAALVTDLMATVEDQLVGPLALAPPIGDWLDTEDVRSGEFHLALLAVRADYWGMTHPRLCPERDGLGCQYRERVEPGERYLRLDGIAKLPLYVVLAGRGKERLVEVAESIKQDLDRLELEAHWELLTDASKTARETLSCELFERSERGQPQYVLLRDTTGFACKQDKEVVLACRLDNGMGLTSAAAAQESAPASLDPDQVWEPLPDVFSAVVSGDEVEVVVDCAALRAWRPPVDVPPRQVRIEVAASPPESEATGAWDGWSGIVEEMGRTVQLTALVDRLRLAPDDYRIVLPTLTVPASERFEVTEQALPPSEQPAEAGETLDE